MKILLVVNPRRLRAWVARLSKDLIACGHQVDFVFHDEPAPTWGQGLAWLERMEAQVLRGRGSNAWRLVAPTALPANAALDGGPDIILNLSQAGQGRAGRLVLTPLFDGSVHEEAALCRLLDGGLPTLGFSLSDGTVIMHGMPAVENRDFVFRAFDQILLRLRAMCLHAIAAIASGQDIPSQAHEPSSLEKYSFSAFNACEVLTAELGRKIVRRLSRALGREAQWKLGYRDVSDRGVWERADLGGDIFNWLPDDGHRYFADPFLLAHEGRVFVFCEEVPKSTNKGIISYFELESGHPLAAPVPVLEETCHLSYPFVFTHAGQIWMIPESSANKTISLYRADPFPSRWTLDAVLVRDVAASDSTLTWDNGFFWLFTTLQEEGTSSWDALGLFYARDLHGPWIAHPLNPVLLDASAARPAGHIVRMSNVLYRPVQDCTKRYGYGLANARVVTLGPDQPYSQIVEARLTPPDTGRLRGVHTINRVGRVEVIDALAFR